MLLTLVYGARKGFYLHIKECDIICKTTGSEREPQNDKSGSTIGIYLYAL